ncbi:DUF664 domain-containing protein [Streptomyces sp. NPDC046976]|uniref:mycothiol transferase n=1 Tax=Streptomyces sp. NPDC046976 TaxID=3155258 RepID=UPI0033FDEF5B
MSSASSTGSNRRIYDRYRREAQRADAVITATAADAPPVSWPRDLFGAPRLHTLRDVLLHVITETACLAGHLDAARELLDGRRRPVLTRGPRPGPASGAKSNMGGPGPRRALA